MPNLLYIYTSNTYDLAWFGFMAYQPFAYLMPNPLYIYTSNTYDLAWFGFMAYQPLLLI